MRYFLFGVLYGFCLLSFPQNIVFDTLPLKYQLFPRDALDSATIPVIGRVITVGRDSVTLEIYKNGLLWKKESDDLVYSSNTAFFGFHPRIHAELAEYSIKVLLDGDSATTVDSVVCGDAYLIMGQSNAVANDYDDSVHYTCEWVRSFRRMTNIGWGLARGDTIYADYSIGVWGLRLGKRIADSQGIPVAIINGALGSTTIESHLRYEPAPTNTYHLYGHLLIRAINAGIKDKARALIWHQGEQNTLDASYLSYAQRFDTLYRAWKEDYQGLEKVYVFQGHPGCGGDYQHPVREIQRKLPETYPDIRVMSTVGLGYHDGCHFHYQGYCNMAERLYGIMKGDLYGSQDTVGASPPNIQRAYYTRSARDEICLVFDQPVLWPADTFLTWNTTTTYYHMQDYFYLEGTSPIGINHQVDSGYAVTGEHKLLLKLAQASNAQHITYLPNKEYSLGPWLKNERGVGALTFFQFPVDSAPGTDNNPAEPNPAQRGEIRVSPNPSHAVVRITVNGILPMEAVGRNRELKIYHMSGKLIMDLSSQLRSPVSGVSWDASAMPSGVYVVRWRMGNEMLERKIMLLR